MHFKHCCNPETMTEADVAQLALEPAVAASVLSANCAGEHMHRDNAMFAPELRGMRIGDVTSTAVAANHAAQPNAGWRVDQPPTMPARLLHADLRNWQAMVVQLFLLPATATQRHLWWFWGVAGDIGKSWLCSCLRQNCRALIIPASASVRDAVCILSDCILQHGQPAIVLFDISRGGTNVIDAAFFESLLNGRTCTIKHNSQELVLGKVHVAIFSNSEPIREEFSLDRWAHRGASTVVNLEKSTVLNVDDAGPTTANPTFAEDTLNKALPRAVAPVSAADAAAANESAPPVTHAVAVTKNTSACHTRHCPKTFQTFSACFLTLYVVRGTRNRSLDFGLDLCFSRTRLIFHDLMCM